MKMLLLEMAVYDEMDVFAMEPVASVQTNAVENIEDDNLISYVWNQIHTIQIQQNYHLQQTDIGTIIRHHCSHRNKKKAALLALPFVINAQYVTRPWRRKTINGELLVGKDKRLSGMISAPILIDNTKYLCNLTLKRSKNGKISPYALSLKDANGNLIENEKMDNTLKVPDSNSEPTTSGNAHLDKVTTSPDINPSLFNAKIQQNKEFTNENNINKQINYNTNMKTNKKTIRLTESDLHNIIKESVNKVLTNEDYKPLGASYSDEHISDVKTRLFRQISNLLSFMNAYSDGILSTNMLDENTYNILYDLLAKIHDRNLIP